MLSHENRIAKLEQNRLDPKSGEIWYKNQWEAFKIIDTGSVEVPSGRVKHYVLMLKLSNDAISTCLDENFVRNWYPHANPEWSK
jgi:hypothetical protein